MAKINMVFDTKTKELNVDIDGTKVTLIDEVQLYKRYTEYDEGNEWEIRLHLKPASHDGMKIATYVSAKKQ